MPVSSFITTRSAAYLPTGAVKLSRKDQWEQQ